MLITNQAPTLLSLRHEIADHIKSWTANKVEFLAITVVGNTVFTERVDTVEIGSVSGTAPVAGIFVLSESKILEWRDYFDYQTFSKQFQQLGADFEN